MKEKAVMALVVVAVVLAMSEPTDPTELFSWADVVAGVIFIALALLLPGHSSSQRRD